MINIIRKRNGSFAVIKTSPGGDRIFEAKSKRKARRLASSMRPDPKPLPIVTTDRRVPCNCGKLKGRRMPVCEDCAAEMQQRLIKIRNREK